VINPKRGFLGTANHKPIQDFYKVPIGISTGSGGDTDRSYRLRQLLESREKFTPEEVLDIHYDTVNAVKKGLITLGYYLRDRQKAELSSEAMKSLDYLEEWFKQGAKSDMEIQGTELANLIPMMFRINTSLLTLDYGGGQSGICNYVKHALERIHEEGAKLDDLEIEYIDQVLRLAWESAERQFRTDPSKWNERAKAELQQRTLGYMVGLDGYDSLAKEHDLMFPSLSCIDGGTILSQVGQSYSQWVPMHDVDTAKSILPIGNSEHPDDPIRKRNYELWSKGELKAAPLSRAAVEKIADQPIVLSK
jgi:acyl-homoserine lactone acylase PvdQ